MGLVRPHLEYAISYWCPYFEKDIAELKKVPRRATIRNLEYLQRLDKLGLSDLKTRRLRGDLIQMYKLLNGMKNVNFVNDINFKFRNKFMRK
ncbi:unnamed protein product [Brachionus calyciflorus]|uniref:Uncharacterized protein n=1 Tax=Brachionus calyciflorus TaxID=104777 RepID=A0A813Y7H8_9BILA|nr:unnamed protein product [Brachionus calyciflorus]